MPRQSTITCSLDGAARIAPAPFFIRTWPMVLMPSVSVSDALQIRAQINTFGVGRSNYAATGPQITASPAALSNQSAPSFSFSMDSRRHFCLSGGHAQPAPASSPAIYVGLRTAYIVSRSRRSDPTSGRSSRRNVHAGQRTRRLLKSGSRERGHGVIPNPSTVNFSGGSADIVGYRCSLDGAAYAACSSPFSQAIYSPGSHSFAVEAMDALVMSATLKPQAGSHLLPLRHCRDYSAGHSNDQISTTSQNFK